MGSHDLPKTMGNVYFCEYSNQLRNRGGVQFRGAGEADK